MTRLNRRYLGLFFAFGLLGPLLPLALYSGNELDGGDVALFPLATLLADAAGLLPALLVSALVPSLGLPRPR